MKRFGTIVLLASAALIACGPATADAAFASPQTFTFEKLTNNAPEILSNQLRVDVIDAGSNQVTFQFRNAYGAFYGTPVQSSITGVYFDDGSLLEIASLENGTGVKFTAGPPVTPPELPGANLAVPVFQTTAGFLADADSPGPGKNGVDIGEWLKITFKLISGKTYDHTIEALLDRSLRIGIHVQSIGESKRSDSYIAPPKLEQPPPEPIPEPSSLVALLGLAVAGGGAGWRRMVRRRRIR